MSLLNVFSGNRFGGVKHAAVAVCAAVAVYSAAAPVASAETVCVSERTVVEQLVMDTSSIFRKDADHLNVVVFRLENGEVVDRFIFEYRCVDGDWHVLTVDKQPFAVEVDRKGGQTVRKGAVWTPVVTGTLAEMVLEPCLQKFGCTR